MAVHLPGTRALATFEAAARHLNFTRAADEVGLTPAAVSYQIKEIEDQLGVVLFSRTSRSMKLTPAGTVLFDVTVEVLNQLRSAVGRARKIARGETRLRVSADPVMAGKWLMPRIDRFRAQHPGVELRFDVSHDVRDFDRDDIDVAIRFGQGKYPDFTAHRLFGTVIVAACSPDLLRDGQPLDKPEDLARFTLAHIEWARNGLVWPNWRMWMTAAGVADFDDSGCVAFGESSQLIQAALAGSVIALVDQNMVARDLAAGRLVRVFDLDIGVPPEFAYYLVYPQGSGEDPRIAAFRNWLTEEVAKPD